MLIWGEGGGEQPVIPQSHHHSALQCQLRMWEMSEAGLRIFLSLAQPQESVPRAHLPANVFKPRIFSIKDFVTQLMCLL